MKPQIFFQKQMEYYINIIRRLTSGPHGKIYTILADAENVSISRMTDFTDFFCPGSSFHQTIQHTFRLCLQTALTTVLKISRDFLKTTMAHSTRVSLTAYLLWSVSKSWLTTGYKFFFYPCPHAHILSCCILALFVIHTYMSLIAKMTIKLYLT